MTQHTVKRFTALALSAVLAASALPATGTALAEQPAATQPAVGQTAPQQPAAGQQGAGSATADAAAQAVVAAIDALPALKNATNADAKAIRQASESMTALTGAQKAQVPSAKAQKLDGLSAALAAADKVAAEIEKLPAKSAVKASDYDGIVAVGKRYDKLAQPALVKSSLSSKLATLEDIVYYATEPVPVYQVKPLGSSKAVTVQDDGAHTYTGGIAKVKVSLPKSGYDSKTSLSGSMSYGVKIAGSKASTATKSAWVGAGSKTKTAQAFRLGFKGAVADAYDVYYRVRVAKLGWSDWASNNSWAGSTGMNLRISGLQVKFVKKGAAAPGQTARPCPGKSTVSYRVNRLDGSWTPYAKSGSTAGSAVWNAGIEQVQVKTAGDLSGQVQTSVLTRSGSWTPYTAGKAGRTSSSEQAQAIRVRLTGELAKVYNVYYRVYASDHHWLGWARNGQKAGTSGHKYPMGAIQVRLVLKGTGAPGSTGEHFTTKAVPSTSGGQLTMLRKAQGYSSATGWLILVNRNTTHVGLFKGSKNDWALVRYMQCDVGATSTPTPRGTRTVQYRIPSFGEEKGYSVYKATNIGGGYFFHSILYYANTRRVMDGTLGSWRSHGCIRLAYSNAKYIYDNVGNGTKVKIY